MMKEEREEKRREERREGGRMSLEPRAKKNQKVGIEKSNLDYLEDKAIEPKDQRQTKPNRPLLRLPWMEPKITDPRLD